MVLSFGALVAEVTMGMVQSALAEVTNRDYSQTT
jgi:hypothetical protein